jgi:amidase
LNIEERALGELQQDLATCRTDSHSLVKQYQQRIEALDRSGPALRSVLELNPDAAQIARELDAERLQTGARGPLHGMPLLIKDNIATLDRMQTTAGSLALVGAQATQDAFVVQRLRAAGAVLLGKANMSEWSNGRSRQSSGGWSARGGLTRNPYVLDRSASGSSSGCAAAVAASLCAAAVGTETDGSILSPASVCGIVGLKPTVGLISRSAIIPLSHSLDTPGPMARNVRDCALLLGAMTGHDRQDPAMQDGAAPGWNDYTAALDSQALRGARLGVLRQFFDLHEAAQPVYAHALAALARAGAVLVDPVRLPQLEALQAAKRTVLLYEMKAGVNAYLQALAPGAKVRSLADVIAFNQEHAEMEMPWFSQDIFQLSQAKGALTDAEYLAALATMRRIARTEGIEAVLREHRLDALMAPTRGPAGAVDLLGGDRAGGASSSPAAAAGTPAITVPAGQVYGLPLGLSFFGNAWRERELLGLAWAFEQLACMRQAPRYLPSLDA